MNSGTNLQSSILNIGIIGCGSVVTDMHLPALVTVPCIRVQWVCDSSAERATRVARNWGIRKALTRIEDAPEVDAVLVATPVGTRLALLDKIMNRRWNALCEKPFASNIEDHREILTAARQKDLIISAGYMRRYFWAVEKAGDLLRATVLGSLREVIASEAAPLDRTGLDQSSYRNDSRASGGGVLFETGCHLVDESMSVCDASAVDICKCEQKIHDGYEVETKASGTITRESGDEVAFHFMVSGVRPVFNGITLRCERGEIRLHLDPAKGLDIQVGASRHPLELQHPNPSQKHVIAAFRKEWIDFVEACMSGQDRDTEKMTGLLTTEVIAQCGRLAKEPLAVNL